MGQHFQTIILGQGLAGSALAWQLHWAGRRVLLIDSGDLNTASRVAAGLITPVTGRRLVRSADYDRCWSAARTFYRRVERELDESLFTEHPMLRLFSSVDQRREFLQSSGLVSPDSAGSAGGESAESDWQTWHGCLQVGGTEHCGLLIRPAGRLQVAAYLDGTAACFRRQGQWRQQRLNLQTDVQLNESAVQIPSLQITADDLICCTGAAASVWFPEVPDNPARGDVLNVSVERYLRPEVVHRGIWIAAETDGSCSVGATYDWDHLQPEPRDEGRDELLTRLSELIQGPVTVHDHVAAVRPTMKDYEPVLGTHPEFPQLRIFNGLGSRGALRAPLLADQLVQQLLHGTAVDPTCDYQRLIKSVQRPRLPLTQVAQQHVAAVVRPGETVIDATVGNGFDTCFLAQLVGERGRVIGFDVQQTAIDSTARRLQAGNFKQVQLHCCGHENLSEVTSPDSVAAVMFNLGYLPRADKQIITRPETSLPAIHQALQALRPGGILTLLVYRGHPGGIEEYTRIAAQLEDPDPGLQVDRIDSQPPKDSSPVLFIIHRLN